MLNIKAIPTALINLLRSFVRLQIHTAYAFFARDIRWNASLVVSRCKAGGSEAVYDIVSAGPRNRFTVLGNDGYYIAHNCLGLQFGMGISKLQIKLSLDTGREITLEQATKLRDLHKRIFARMWEWRDEITREYFGYNGEGKQVLTLMDGWCLLPNNDSQTSTANFPVQGTGGVIMREAIRRAHEAGICILYGQHDAIYAMSKNEELEETKNKLLQVMNDAVLKYLPEGIRNEGKEIEHGIPYVEKPARKMWERMKEFVLELKTQDSELEYEIDKYLASMSEK